MKFGQKIHEDLTNLDKRGDEYVIRWGHETLAVWSHSPRVIVAQRQGGHNAGTVVYMNLDRLETLEVIH